MYISDGFVCGDTPIDEMMKVKDLKVLDNRIMLLTFSTGETRLFDATILKGSAFLPLEDDDVFKNPVISHGVVTWKNEEIDCAPEFMYENSYEYNSGDYVVA